LRFGVYLPTYAWSDLGFEEAESRRKFARRAEALGFDALWVIEHFAVAASIYGTAWMSPMLCLTDAAAVTSRIRLVPGLLILPYYHPVTLARQIQTIHHLSGGRFVMGIAPGFDPHEFAALGMRTAERGERTDEILDAVRRLLTEREVTFKGRHYQFENLTIEPVLPAFPELWVGGGSKVESVLSPDRARMHPSVLRRIGKADGWLARASGSPQMLKDDLNIVRGHLEEIGRDPKSLIYGHVNFVHLVDAPHREQAVLLQQPKFQRVMGTHRSFEQLQESYFLGTTNEIIDRIGELERLGFEYLLLGTVDQDLEQLERIASEIVPHFSS